MGGYNNEADARWGTVSGGFNRTVTGSDYQWRAGSLFQFN